MTFTQSDGSGTPRVEIIEVLGIGDADLLEELQLRDAGGALTPLQVTGSTAAELIRTNGPDTLDGGDGDDVISSLDGDNIVTGGLGNNTVDLGAGNDTYTGGGTTETVRGGNGDDTLTDVLPVESEAGAILFDGGAAMTC